MKLVLSGKPVSVNQLYRGRRFLTPLGTATKADYSYQAKKQYKGAVLEGPVKVEVHVYFANAAADIDNALKGFFDSMTGLLWKDDKQIVELHAYKLIDKQRPRIEISVVELEV